MSLPEFTKKLIEEKLSRYCSGRIPEHIRDKVKLIFDINGNNVTLIETRPFFKDPSIWTKTPVVQFRLDNDKKQWRIYCIGRNDRWRLYDLIKPTSNFDDLLKELDHDPTGIFWG